MPLLAEEILDLTVRELIEEHGAQFVAEETWFGYVYQVECNGVHVWDITQDTVYPEDFKDFF